jgi:carboxylesterase type B
VQDYINLVGGHKDYVTAWGESAGAGSILHHITAFGGKQDPLFRQVVMQSITSELLADRRGDTESFYQEFLAKAKCGGQSLACLRSASFETLNAANLALISDTPPSAFKPGPAADGNWVRQMPALELASGNFFQNLSGLILSHVAHEADIFAIGSVTSDAAFVRLTNFNIPVYAPSVRQAVANHYPSPNSIGSPYATQDARTMQYLDDTLLLCNYRYLNSAFQNITWSMQYSVSSALHATDLTPTFFNANETGANIKPEQGTLFSNYQNYLTFFSVTGVPNAERIEGGPLAKIYWPKTIGQQDEKLSNVLNVTDTGFEIITDQESLKSHCDFFLNVQAAVTLAGGYVPPAGAVPNSLGVTNSNPSGNYTTPT